MAAKPAINDKAAPQPEGRAPSAPRVSVLIPVHNGERFLAAAIESVLAQTEPDFELVVVDDGSTDATPQIVTGFGDRRITLLSPGRVGVCAASNLGLDACRSDIVARLDADDVMEPNRLERQLAFLEARPELGAAASYHWWIDEAGEIRGFHDSPLHTVEDVERYIEGGGRLMYSHPTMMFRRKAVLAVGGYDTRYRTSEDVDLCLRMYDAGFPAVVQPERLTRFRIHRGSVSVTRARELFFTDEVIFRNFRARRRGAPQITMAEHMAELAGAPFKRLAVEAKILSAALLRRRLELTMQGRRLQALGVLAGASLLNPGAVAARLRRVIPLGGLNRGSGQRRAT